MTTGVAARDADREGGFGLVEVVIAMFLLALLALATLPTFASAMKLSAQNLLVGRATGLTRQHLADLTAQAQGSDGCAGLARWLGDHSAPLREAAPNADLDYRFSLGSSCPSGPLAYPTTLTVTVIVSQHGSATGLATAQTRVAVLVPGS